RTPPLKSIVTAARMNKSVVMFVDDVSKAEAIVLNGVVVNGTVVKVFPLSTPARHVILSNVPPFIDDEDLCTLLSRFGKVVSPVKMLPTGCKDPELRHIYSYRRQAYDSQQIETKISMLYSKQSPMERSTLFMQPLGVRSVSGVVRRDTWLGTVPKNRQQVNRRQEQLQRTFRKGNRVKINRTVERITHRQRIRKKTNSKGQPQKVKKGGKTLRQRQWWDHGKVLIQQLCREYTVNITRDITKSLKDLEIGIVELQALAHRR
ncbi:hypothetical protein QTP86_029883, partial [Hemibagrus guttatus]